jgi:hypothetical protein
MVFRSSASRAPPFLGELLAFDRILGAQVSAARSWKVKPDVDMAGEIVERVREPIVRRRCQAALAFLGMTGLLPFAFTRAA